MVLWNCTKGPCLHEIHNQDTIWTEQSPLRSAQQIMLYRRTSRQKFQQTSCVQFLGSRGEILVYFSAKFAQLRGFALVSHVTATSTLSYIIL